VNAQPPPRLVVAGARSPVLAVDDRRPWCNPTHPWLVSCPRPTGWGRTRPAGATWSPRSGSRAGRCPRRAGVTDADRDRIDTRRELTDSDRDLSVTGSDPPSAPAWRPWPGPATVAGAGLPFAVDPNGKVNRTVCAGQPRSVGIGATGDW